MSSSTTTQQQQGGGVPPGKDDVLCGRGALTNHHPGNKAFRALVALHQPAYVEAKKVDKEGISRTIVSAVQARGGNFVTKDPNSGEWVPIDDKKAILKTSQALREGMNVRKLTATGDATEGADGNKETSKKTKKNSKSTSAPTAPLPNQPIAPRPAPLAVRPQATAPPPPANIHTPSNMPVGSAAANGTLTENDVLCGRGGGTNAYVGNIKFRAVVAHYRPRYLTCKRTEKESIAASIVQTIQQRGGRFLFKNEDCQWEELEDQKAVLKCSQALREGMNVRSGTLKTRERESKFVAAMTGAPQQLPPSPPQQPPVSPSPPKVNAAAANLASKLPTMSRSQLEAVARAMLNSGDSQAVDAAIKAFNEAAS